VFGTLRNQILAIVAGLGVLAPGPGAGQVPSEQRGALTGTVVDVGSGEPLPLARVTLLPAPTGVLPAAAGASGILTGSRTVLTDIDGLYRFPGIGAGTYRIHVRRIGYRPVSMDLTLEGAEGLTLSVGLAVAPIRLEPLTATSPPTDMFDQRPQSSGGQPTWDRVAQERWRQATFLETDVRMLSGEEAVEAITLGETDILRALQRLPGVSTRDDWTAGLWVRGAPPSQTRIYFDGLPLFNPVHAGGFASAIGADGVGGVFLHPGARSVQMGSGAAGVVDVTSRTAGGNGDVRGRASLTTSNVGLALDRRWLDGRLGTLVSARRSWLNRTRDLVRSPDGISPEIPNDYADVIARVDADLGGGRVIEASGIWERDWIDGALTGGPASNTSSWGTLAARTSFLTPLFGGIARQTLGFSRFDAAVRQIEPHAPLAAFDDFLPVQEPTDNEILYVSLAGEWTRYDENAIGPKWHVGYNLFRETVGYRGAPTAPYSVPTYLYTLDVEGEVLALNLWAERFFRPSDKLAIRLGVRFEIDAETASDLLDPERVVNDDPGQVLQNRLSPQISLRYSVTERLSVALANSNHFQYEQAVAPSGVDFGPALSVSPIWWLPPKSRTGLAARTELNTVGAEYWVNDEWLASANYFDRTTEGLAIPDPRPGSVDDDEFRVNGTNSAHGLELSLRRLAGPWTGSLGYTLSESTYEAVDVGLQFPSPADRRHVLDVTAMTKISEDIVQGTMRIGGTFSAASGAPFTRIHPGIYDCSNYEPGGFCIPIIPTTVEAQNAERSPWSSAFNVLIDWGRSFTHWDLAAHVQVQNLLNAPRAVTYAVDTQACRRLTMDSPACGPDQDRFLPGLRRHYELGVRLVF
jgi:hypothetical protein